MTDHHQDLISAARNVLTAQPHLAGWLSINDTTGTVSDRRDGTVHAYVARAWTDLSAEELLGWHVWPSGIRVR